MDNALFNHYTFQSGEPMINYKEKIAAFLFLVILNFPVYTQTLFEQIGWRGADSSIIIGLVLTLITVVSFLVLLHLRARNLQKNEMIRLAYNTFQKNVEQAELTGSETQKLKSLLRHANITHPHIIFQSVALFEKCIDVEVSQLLQQNKIFDKLDYEENVMGILRKKLGYSFLPHEHPLISTRNIEVGQKLSIIDRRSKLPLIQSARVVDNREFYFRIQYDPENEEGLGVLEGQAVMLAFARQGDGVYGVQVVICAKDQCAFDVRHTMELSRNQLRQYARIDVNIPVRMRLIRTASEEEKSLTGGMFDGRMVDISGGGVCIINDKSLIPGDIVSLNFNVSDCKITGIAARILRVSLQEIYDATFYRHSLQFVNIEHTIREKIIKFVFEKQRQINQWR